MNSFGKICGILSGILAAIIIYVLGSDALQTCLQLSGSSVNVLPNGEWFSQLMVFVNNYGIYILILLSLSQVFSAKTKNGAGILFIIYLMIAFAFIAVIFFPNEVIDVLK